MELKLEIMNALCACQVFKINGIDADENDFGSKEDKDIENAIEYGCGDMTFERKPASDEILKKYGIDLIDYNEVCEKLEKGLSFGGCGWCV